MEHLGLCLFACQMRYYKMIYWGELLHFASREKNVSVSRRTVADWDPTHAASLWGERGSFSQLNQ